MIRKTLDSLMEKSVIPSFTSIGPRVRSRLFDWRALESYDLTGRVVVLTGATSGIGEAGAELYAKLGATLVIVARNAEKAQRMNETLKSRSGNSNISSVIGDLGSTADVRRIAAELGALYPSIDVLVHNAGALFNSRKRAESGTDMSVELMVATPFLLTGLLLPQLRANSDPGGGVGKIRSSGAGRASPGRASPGRVLTMSSGGMYTQGLTVDHLEMPDWEYQGAKQYARAKRAQVVLNEMWAEKVPPVETVFHALHPGWVNTPGITEALPGFSRVLGPLGLLRNPREGADTMLWLSADEEAARTSGGFWHDRQLRSIDMTATTRQADTPERRNRLWEWCEQHTGWHFDRQPQTPP